MPIQRLWTYQFSGTQRDLLLWMSFQVEDNRPSSAAQQFTSTVFPHGLFFAHNPERFDLLSSFTLNKSSPDQSVPQKWSRDPDSGYY
jgi:hypothetical protein